MPCAKNSGCAYEFTEEYRSYCDVHFNANTYNTSEIHDANEPCGICALPMGQHDQIQSFQLVCCADNRWFHKKCFKKMAFALNDDFECPSCDNQDEFRENMLANGIYIPTSTYLPPAVDEHQVPNPKRKRIHKNWVRAATFASKKMQLLLLNPKKFGHTITKTNQWKESE